MRYIRVWTVAVQQSPPSHTASPPPTTYDDKSVSNDRNCVETESDHHHRRTEPDVRKNSRTKKQNHIVAVVTLNFCTDKSLLAFVIQLLWIPN